MYVQIPRTQERDTRPTRSTSNPTRCDALLRDVLHGVRTVPRTSGDALRADRHVLDVLDGWTAHNMSYVVHNTSYYVQSICGT